jgi:hypothetical protein
MDTAAAFGALVVTDGAVTPAVFWSGVAQELPAEPLHWSVQHQQNADQTFAHYTATPRQEPGVAHTLMVVSAGMAALREVVADGKHLDRPAAKDEEDDEEVRPDSGTKTA